jgi:hypothetical protein
MARALLRGLIKAVLGGLLGWLGLGLLLLARRRWWPG